jgi:hypothetical protein
LTKDSLTYFLTITFLRNRYLIELVNYLLLDYLNNNYPINIMCGGIISRIFGGRDSTPTPPTPAPPTTPPVVQQVQRTPVEPPVTPTPTPVQEDETKRKAKVTGKKIKKKARSQGTTQLQTKKPSQGGLKGTDTPQGVNTGALKGIAGTASKVAGY